MKIEVPRIVSLALRYGFITNEQLLECMKLHKKEDQKPIEQVLKEKGYLRPEHVDEILKNLKEEATSQKQSLRQKAKDTARRFKDTARKLKSQTTRFIRRVGFQTPRERKLILYSTLIVFFISAFALTYFLISRKSSAASKPVVPVSSTTGHKSPIIQKEQEKEYPDVITYEIDDSNSLAGEWNELIKQIQRAHRERKPDLYMIYYNDIKKMISKIEEQITDSSSKDYYKRRMQMTLLALEDALKQRTRFLFNFFKGQATSFALAGKYGEAVRTYDWFPEILAQLEGYKENIQREKEGLLKQARVFYRSLSEEFESLLRNNDYKKARLVLVRALEIDIEEITKDAYQRLSELTKQEEQHIKLTEETEIKQREEELLTQKRWQDKVDVLRKSVLELIAQRKLELAKDIVSQEKRSSLANESRDYHDELEHIVNFLTFFDDLFEFARSELLKRKNNTVTIGFIYPDSKITCEGILIDISKEKVSFKIGDRIVKEDLYWIDTSELARLIDQIEGKKLYLMHTLIKILEGDLSAAYSEIVAVEDDYQAVAKFIENSAEFISKNSSEIKKKAQDNLKNKNYHAAITELSKLVLVESEKKDALSLRAQAYYMNGDFVAAFKDIEALVDLNVINPEIVNLLDQIYQRANIFDRSIKIYERALKTFPDNPSLVANLCKLYMQTHDFDKATEIIRKAPQHVVRNSLVSLQLDLLNHVTRNPFSGQVFKASLGRYDVFTDIDPDATNKIAGYMDEIYAEYHKLFSYRKNEALRFYVKVFEHESDFLRYYEAITGGSIKGKTYRVGGFYLDVVKELVLFKEPDQEMLETLRHEGFHQYLDYFVNNCPVWFNEGFACYFETSSADTPQFNQQRAMEARDGLTRNILPPLKDLLLMSNYEFRTHKSPAHLYGQSWSFIYYLVKCGKKDLLDRYFEELMQGKGQKEAFDNVFGKINFDALAAKWRLAVFNNRYDE